MPGPPQPRRLDQPITVSPEELVPKNHFCRRLEAKLDLSFVRECLRRPAEMTAAVITCFDVIGRAEVAVAAADRSHRRPDGVPGEAPSGNGCGRPEPVRGEFRTTRYPRTRGRRR